MSAGRINPRLGGAGEKRAATAIIIRHCVRNIPDFDGWQSAVTSERPRTKIAPISMVDGESASDVNSQRRISRPTTEEAGADD
jgi:hypothetical protein